MSTKIITARCIVSGVSDEQSPDVIEYAGLAYKDGIVLSLGPAEDIKHSYPGMMIWMLILTKNIKSSCLLQNLETY